MAYVSAHAHVPMCADAGMCVDVCIDTLKAGLPTLRIRHVCSTHVCSGHVEKACVVDMCSGNV